MSDVGNIVCPAVDFMHMLWIQANSITLQYRDQIATTINEQLLHVVVCHPGLSSAATLEFLSGRAPSLRVVLLLEPGNFVVSGSLEVRL